VDLAGQRVVLTSSLPTEDVRALIETTGKRAVLLGVGVRASAVAMLGGVIGCSTRDGVVGVVRFSQTPGTEGCVVDGTIDGLAPGSDHALAIHESGDLSGGCATTGAHFNPGGRGRHGSPDDEERHVGDLGNVRADASGRASFKFVDRLVAVNDIIGRSVVVAEGPDDLGRGDTPLSKINGNCGQLLSCGIIARSAGLFENAKRICACDGVSLWDERDKPLAGPGRSASDNNTKKNHFL